MKLISWNVNGLRAVERKGALPPLWKQNPDILFLNETKAHPEQLSKELQDPKGFHVYFSSATTRKGYSGVALYTKVKPDKVLYDIKDMKDEEGRYIEAHYGKLVFIGCYFPNGGGEPHRLKYKLCFYDQFLVHIERLRKNGHSIIFCGDVNAAHEEIDLARPKANEGEIGFLPEERAWIDEVISAGYVDSFRHFHLHTKDAYTYWDMKTRSRDRNVGWRIDYFFIANEFMTRVKKAEIHPDIYGSDHCPLSITLS